MIARRAGPPFISKVMAPLSEYGVFPILLSTDFRRNQKQVIDEAVYGCELSRLVILPAYRGFGISRVLIKAAIAKAFQLKRKSLLLECIPKHVEMYAKYGFKRLDGAPHSRPSDLDQYAIGMRLSMTQNEVAGRAKQYLLQILQQQRDFDCLQYGPFEVEGDVALPSSVDEGSQSDSSYF
jgi:GNAT superfamily N-acetyltransferase